MTSEAPIILLMYFGLTALLSPVLWGFIFAALLAKYLKKR